MSESTICAHCGAPLEYNKPVCQFCGSVVPVSAAAVVDQWVLSPDQMPPASPSDPGRSILVLGCFPNSAKGAEIFGCKYDGLYAVYYDFEKGKWRNDLYKEKLTFKNQKEVRVKFWRSIPPSSSPDWISAKECIPEFKGSTELETINVLTCRKGSNYENSVIMGSISFIEHDEGMWEAMINFDTKGPDAQKIEVTHWMPLPDINI